VKFLLTSSGNAGSWTIRGQQLGAAIGAAVARDATAEQMAAADVVVLVKRCSPELIARAQASGRRIVWDIVDPWPQPDGNVWSGPQAISWLRGEIARIKPHAIVCATERMRSDIAFAGPSITLRHHARPAGTAWEHAFDTCPRQCCGLQKNMVCCYSTCEHKFADPAAINPIRRDVKTVGYEGDQRYLGAWRELLEIECRSRGWEFVVNPRALADLDIVVALRAGPWTGYAPRHHKSNVKLANAQATGTPCILSPECGYEETATGAEYWASSLHELHVSFDWLAPHENRLEVSRRLLMAKGIALKEVAEKYADWLRSL